MKANNEIYVFLVLIVDAAGCFFWLVCFLLLLLLCFVLLQPNFIERTKIDQSPYRI